MRASSKKQWELFGRPIREVRPESSDFYAAVVYLRQVGCKVIRISSKQSRVEGALRNNRQLMEMARKLGWDA